jgi:hypothetical protein
MTKTSTRYSPEVRERAVRLVLDHQKDHLSQCAAIQSIAPSLEPIVNIPPADAEARFYAANQGLAMVA